MKRSFADPTAIAALGLGYALLAGCQSGSGLQRAVSLPQPAASGPSAQPVPGRTPAANATPQPSGGLVEIVIPTPAPIACSPSPLFVTATQIGIVTCGEPGYAGPMTVRVDDPAIATVRAAEDLAGTFFVMGTGAGTTFLTLRGADGSFGSSQIVVAAP